MKSLKLPLAVLGLCLTLVLACTGASGEGETDLDGREPPQFERPPATTASSGGATAEMGIGTFCWTNACVDYIGPITKGSLRVTNGAEVTVAVPAGLMLTEVHASLWPATGAQTINTGDTAWVPSQFPDDLPDLPATISGNEVRVRVSAPTGQHVLVVGMWFASGGDVQYSVVIDLQ